MTKISQLAGARARTRTLVWFCISLVILQSPFWVWCQEREGGVWAAGWSGIRGGRGVQVSGGSVDTAPASRCHCDSRAPQSSPPEGGRVRSPKARLGFLWKQARDSKGKTGAIPLLETVGRMNNITHEESNQAFNKQAWSPCTTCAILISLWLSFPIHQMGITAAASPALCED